MQDIINNYDLFIFDLDDTLVKTEHLHYISWLSVLKRSIGEYFYISFSIYCSKFHSNKVDCIRQYLKNELCIQDYESCVQEKNDYYLDLITKEKDKLALIAGVEAFITEVVKNKKEFVIVSNTQKINVMFFLDLFPILQKCSKVYYREMFRNKKPNPECYFMVCTDFPNTTKIGFEDSITGIHALNGVEEIDTVFINNKDYYYYDYILANYKILKCIENYNW
uniref:Haloacid dehalogenase-like hydrolase n=1 Tax=viral metagenome TaxID=1070528 RepID=A0A6C0ASG6_9ZZZZ